jgi:MSHA biogenesis protein MshO
VRPPSSRAQFAAATQPGGLSRRHAGFTLIEAVVVIVITGIIAVMVAVFMRTPVEGYFDSVRRAELTDAADTALRRMARDVRAALPNSLRTSGSTCFEFLPMVAGGRYRFQNGTGAGSFEPLIFTAADSIFDVLGSVNLPPPAGTHHVVVYNLGIPGADAYLPPADPGSTRAQIFSATTASVTLTTPKLFPFESPSKRFQVIENNSVVYACVGLLPPPGTNPAGDGAATLYRYTRTPIPSSTVSCSDPLPGNATVLVGNVSACSFSYTSAVTQRNGVLSLTLELMRSNERVQIYQEVHVDNAP